MQIIGAFYEHGVILFRNQELTEDQQLRFARYFGELGERSLPRDRWPEGADHNPKIMLISNIRKKGKPIGSLPDGELWFHHDMCYVQSSPKATFLYAVEVPTEGGNTRFANYVQGLRCHSRHHESEDRRAQGTADLRLQDDGKSGYRGRYQ